MIMSMSKRVASRFMKQNIQLKDIVVGSPNKADREVLEGYLDWVNKGHKSKRDIESLADHDWLMFLNVEKALQRLEYSYLKGQYESYKEDGVSFDVVYNSLKKLSKLR